jgi:hypothetical protein
VALFSSWMGLFLRNHHMLQILCDFSIPKRINSKSQPVTCTLRIAPGRVAKIKWLQSEDNAVLPRSKDNGKWLMISLAAR